jgi:hypothetical protein
VQTNRRSDPRRLNHSSELVVLPALLGRVIGNPPLHQGIAIILDQLLLMLTPDPRIQLAADQIGYVKYRPRIGCELPIH